jgi:hypothetical protein
MAKSREHKNGFTMYNKYLSSESTIVKQLTNDPKFEGSNTACTSTKGNVGHSFTTHEKFISPQQW